MKTTEYTNEVLNYLEYLNYPDYVDHLEPEGVALTMSKVIGEFYQANYSHRTCALVIFSLTWNKIKSGVGIINQQVN